MSEYWNGFATGISVGISISLVGMVILGSTMIR